MPGGALDTPAGARGKHLVVGAGAVGLLMASHLAAAGIEVLLVTSDSTKATFPDAVCVRSPRVAVGPFSVPTLAQFDGSVDVVWLCTRAQQIPAALQRVKGTAAATWIALSNGLVIPLDAPGGATIVRGLVYAEVEREAAGIVRQDSLFADIEFSVNALDARGSSAIHATARASVNGLTLTLRDVPENVLVWQKMAMLIPMALATCVAAGPMSRVREQPALERALFRCADELVTLSQATGTPVYGRLVRRRIRSLPGRSMSSAQRDATSAGRREIIASCRTAVELATRNDVSIDATEGLMSRVEAQIEQIEQNGRTQ